MKGLKHFHPDVVAIWYTGKNRLDGQDQGNTGTWQQQTIWKMGPLCAIWNQQRENITAITGGVRPGKKKNIIWFRSLGLTDADLEPGGMHPVLGEVTLKNLLATWVVHDLTQSHK